MRESARPAWRLPAVAASLAIALGLPPLLVAAAPRVDPAIAAAAAKLNPRSAHSVSIRLLDSGEEIYLLNATKPRRIASVSKIFTAATALAQLGYDYRFRTGFYADDVVGPSVGNLYIKGYGDPLLISEEWHDIAALLPVIEVRGDVLVDDSYFSPHLELVREPGVPNPYNALNAAFATNFNTLEVTVEDGRVSGEPQTPLTPFTVFQVQKTRRGPVYIDQSQTDEALKIRLRGPFRRQARTLRFHLGHDPRTPALYAGNLFGAIFAQTGGVPLTGAIRRGELGAKAELIYEHRSSRPLSKIVAELFEYSNNFVANQVFLVLGAERAGPPANVKKSLTLLTTELARRTDADQVKLVEGSGLDPRNTATASAITRYLAAIHAEQPDFVDLLPERIDGRARAKTGTYKDFGVRAMAGYLVDTTGEPYASFALMCDHHRCASRAYSRFDKLLEQSAAVLAPSPEPAAGDDDTGAAERGSGD